jgi:hypothetical protein
VLGSCDGSLFYVDDRNGWFQQGTNTLSISLSDPSQEDQGVRLQLLNTLTIDPTVTIDGTGTVTDNYNGEGQELIDNQGTIDADVSGDTLTVSPYAFVNDGLAEATNGGILTINSNWVNQADGTISAVNSTLNLEGSYVNFGTITATGSAVNLYGNFSLGNLGNFERTGGSVTLYGMLNLDGQTIDTTQGPWLDLFVSGGTIDPPTDDTIIDGPGGTLGFSSSSANTLSDATVEGGLTITSAASAQAAFVRLDNGRQILDAAGQNPGKITIGDGSICATVDFLGYSDLVNNVTLANGSSALYFSHSPSGVSTFDTGIDAGNDPPALAGGQNDANWTVNGSPAVVLSRNNQGSANFTADSATSGWIGVTDTQSQPTGVSTFSNVFNLASPQSGVLAGLWWLGSYGNATAGAALTTPGPYRLTSSQANSVGTLSITDAAATLSVLANTFTVGGGADDQQHRLDRRLFGESHWLRRRDQRRHQRQRLHAGQSSGLNFSFSTTAAGSVNGSVTLDFRSDGTPVGDGSSPNDPGSDLGTQQVAVSATVDNYAVAALEKAFGAGTFSGNAQSGYTLNFGTVAEGSGGGTLSADVDALNAALGPAADVLGGSFTPGLTNADFSGSGFGSFSNLAFQTAALAVEVDAGDGERILRGAGEVETVANLHAGRGAVVEVIRMVEFQRARIAEGHGLGRGRAELQRRALGDDDRAAAGDRAGNRAGHAGAVGSQRRAVLQDEVRRGERAAVEHDRAGIVERVRGVGVVEDAPRIDLESAGLGDAGKRRIEVVDGRTQSRQQDARRVGRDRRGAGNRDRRIGEGVVGAAGQRATDEVRERTGLDIEQGAVRCFDRACVGEGRGLEQCAGHLRQCAARRYGQHGAEHHQQRDSTCGDTRRPGRRHDRRSDLPHHHVELSGSAGRARRPPVKRQKPASPWRVRLVHRANHRSGPRWRRPRGESVDSPRAPEVRGRARARRPHGAPCAAAPSRVPAARAGAIRLSDSWEIRCCSSSRIKARASVIAPCAGGIRRGHHPTQRRPLHRHRLRRLPRRRCRPALFPESSDASST